MNKEKKIFKNILGFIFASMHGGIWCIIVAVLSYLSMEFIKPSEDYLDIFKYGWGGIALYYAVFMFVWIFISDEKYSIIGAITVALLGRNIYGLFLLGEISGKFVAFFIFAMVAVTIMVLLEIISTVCIKYYKLQHFYKKDALTILNCLDVFDEEDDENDDKELKKEDDHIIEIVKLMNTEMYYEWSYPLMIRKVLKEHAWDTKAMSDEERADWDKRVVKVEAVIGEGAAKSDHEEYVFSYFYLAYFCNGAYSKFFTKENANKYLEEFILKRFFEYDKFNKMVEEGIEGLATDVKCDLITEVYSFVKPKVHFVNIIQANKEHFGVNEDAEENVEMEAINDEEDEKSDQD